MACTTVCGSLRIMTVFPRSAGSKRRERVEQQLPTRLPAIEQHLARVFGIALELGVAMPIGLLAIGREKVGPPRSHVARDMLHDKSNAVGVGVNQGKKLRIVHLRHRLVGLGLQPPELEEAVIEEVPLDQ